MSGGSGLYSRASWTLISPQLDRPSQNHVSESSSQIYTIKIKARGLERTLLTCALVSLWDMKRAIRLKEVISESKLCL